MRYIKTTLRNYCCTKATNLLKEEKEIFHFERNMPYFIRIDTDSKYR